MEVTEAERHRLFRWLEEHMGPENAATTMHLIPPVGWPDLATKADLAELERRLDLRFETIDLRFDAIDQRFGAVDDRIESATQRLRSDLLRTFGTWLFASQAAVIAAVGVMLAVS
jgi:hypothetical protein